MFSILKAASLIIIQSDATQNPIPFLKTVISSTSSNKLHRTFLLALSIPPSCFVPHPNVDVLDWTGKIPGYVPWSDPCAALLEHVQKAPFGPISIIIESVDVLSQDYQSVAKSFKSLSSLLSLVRDRPNSSRLVVGLSFDSPLLPLLTPPSFSPSLTLLTLHSSALIHHISRSYLTPPPPHSPPDKFWALFTPAAARGQGERLALAGADGLDDSRRKGIVEIVLRGTSNGRRGVDRSLEGWILNENGNLNICPWDQLQGLQTLQPASNSAIPTDPTQSLALSFNLNLTNDQQRARSQVPLPYAHQGQDNAGKILYEPDSADDMDDEDPDEDLDI